MASEQELDELLPVQGAVPGDDPLVEARITSEEDEAAFWRSRLKLLIPRRPRQEPFSPYADREANTRKFIVQGELLKVHVLIQGPELMVNPHTPLRGDGESESSAHQATQFISDAFFSRLKFEVLFQTQKFDAKLHALQFLAKGKGKPSLTDTRPKHTFGADGTSDTGVPQPQFTRLDTGDILYTIHIPIALQEKFVSEKLTLILALRPTTFSGRCDSPPDWALEQMKGTKLESRTPIVRNVHTRIRLRQPLAVHFARHSIDSVHCITLSAENTWSTGSLDLPQAEQGEACLEMQNIWLQKDATKLLTASSKAAAEPKGPEVAKKSDLSTSTPAPLFGSSSAAPLPSTPVSKSVDKVTTGTRKVIKLVKIEFDQHFRHSIEKGDLPLRLGFGDCYASAVTIEALPGASSMGDAIGTLQSTLMVEWSAACLTAPILSRYDFQWPKLESPSLLLSLHAPSPAPLGETFPLHFTLCNAGPMRMALELLLPSVSPRSPSHPPPIDSLSQVATTPHQPSPNHWKPSSPQSVKGSPTSSLSTAASFASTTTPLEPQDRLLRPPSLAITTSGLGGAGSPVIGRPRASSRGQHRRTASLDNPTNINSRVPQRSPAQAFPISPSKDGRVEPLLPIPTTPSGVGLLFCLQKMVTVGELEANSSVRVRVDFVAGQEGVYEMKQLVAVDTLTNQRFVLQHIPLIYVLAPSSWKHTRPVQNIG